MIPHPPRPADEGDKCKTCGGSGKQVFASADHPSSMRRERPCPDCSPRPEDGKEGKKIQCEIHDYECHSAKRLNDKANRKVPDDVVDFNALEPAPVADAGGWRERFKTEFCTGMDDHDDENCGKCATAIRFIECKLQSLLDEAVREVEKRLLSNLDFVNDHDEVTWRAAAKAAIAALTDMKKRV